MNKFFICFFAICFTFTGFAQNNVGIGTASPDQSAVLELFSLSQGFLAPRTKVALVTSPATGLVIFDTDTACYVLFDGTNWKNLCMPHLPPAHPNFNDSVRINPDGTITVIDSAGGNLVTTRQSAWTTLGNSGTSAATNFAGTTDAQDFVLKANNAEVLRATTAGAVGINTPVPDATSILDITSTTKGVLFPALTTTQRDAIAGPAVGLTVYNTDLNVHQFWNGTCWVNVGQTVCSFTYATNYINPSHTSDCLLVSNFSSVNDTINVSLVSGTASPVILTAVGVPAGVIASFSNNYILPTAGGVQSIMTFTALPSAASGTYNITVLASSGSTVQILHYTLVVFGFGLNVSPPDTTVSVGNLAPGGYISQALVSIGNASSCGTTGGTAQLTASINGPLNTGISVSFANSSMPIPGSTVMTINSNCPPAGVYTITVQAQIGVTSSYATYTLTVTPASAIHITASTNNVDLAALIGPGHCAGSDTIYVDAGVTIGSVDPTLPSMTTGAIPAGGSLTIINNGSIIGAGGNGGSDNGRNGTSCPNADGQKGGDAIYIASNIHTNIVNNGVIASGGGGGGVGEMLDFASACLSTVYGGEGGGGQGVTGGLGGTRTSCNVGGNGNASGPGNGGNQCNCSILFVSSNSGAGGNGGALGQPGARGSGSGTGLTINVCSQGNGGAAGFAIYSGSGGSGCGCWTATGAALVGPTQ